MKEEENKAFLWLKWRAIIALILAFPLVMQMVADWLGWPYPLSPWVQFALATPVQFVAGYSFYLDAFRALKKGKMGMDLLVVIGTSAAYFYSAAALIFHFSTFLYFETSAVLVALILLGRLIEERSSQRATKGMQALLHMQADTVTVVKGGDYVDIPIEEVQIKDRILIRPGEKIGVDGKVVKGASHVDESMLTGESERVSKQVGDKAFAGTLNKEGSIEIEASHLGKETRLGAIIRLVKEAQQSRPPIQKLVDKVSSLFIPAVLIAAALTFLGWGIIASDWTEGLLNSIAVLVIACPCALGLATPTVITVACAKGAHEGILFKEIGGLEKARTVDTFIIDKTGTVTEGKVSVQAIETAMSKNTFLELVGSLALYSDHPLSKAINAHLKKEGISTQSCQDFHSEMGKGISGVIKGETYRLGSLSFLTSFGVDLSEYKEALKSETNTIALFSKEKQPLGYLVFADQIRAQSIEAVSKLRRMGKKVYLLSGDRKSAVESVAKKLGVDGFFAEVLPEEKANYVKKLQGERAVVGMVGDGINDAPALATADVGFAIAEGTDVAMESADVGLMRSSLLLLISALKLSSLTFTKIWQNLFFAFFYNLLGIPLAAFGLLSPVIAGSAMALSSISVVLNALTLQRKKLLD